MERKMNIFKVGHETYRIFKLINSHYSSPVSDNTSFNARPCKMSEVPGDLLSYLLPLQSIQIL